MNLFGKVSMSSLKTVTLSTLGLRERPRKVIQSLENLKREWRVKRLWEMRISQGRRTVWRLLKSCHKKILKMSKLLRREMKGCRI